MEEALCGVTKVVGKDGEISVSDLVQGKTCVGKDSPCAFV